MHLIKAFLAALVVVVMSNANAQPSDESFSDFAIAKFDLAIGGAQTITTREGNDTFNAQNIYDIEATPEVGISGLNQGFVKTRGTKFVVNNKLWYCGGTNAYYAALKRVMSDNEVAVMMKAHAARGANVLRVFAHNDFSPDGMQPSLGVYNEDAIKRLDLVLVAAAQQGIRLILVLTNYWPFVGGMQKWVDNGIGPGNDLELFYTDPVLRDYYKKWVRHIVTRTNTYTGQRYIDDPTIFSFELANEPRTSGNYERSKGIPPGTLVCNWIKEMSAYIKSLDPKHLVSTGEEGFRSEGSPQEPHSWVNTGYDGGNWKCSINTPSVDFGTLHLYPDQWNMPDYTWLGPNYISDRKKLAVQANKPIILEEYGMGGYGYLPNRDILFSYLHDRANADDFACTIVWAVAHYSTDQGTKGALFGSNDGQGYVFAYDGDGSKEINQQLQVMKNKANGGCGNCGTGPVSNPRPTPPSTCTDIPPSGNDYTCQQQKDWSQCTQPWMEGFCLESCGKCCTDIPPPGNEYTCQQQKEWQKCGESWMNGYCLFSCGKCP